MSESPKISEEKKRIVASALRYKGKEYTGQNHGEAFDALRAAHPEIDVAHADAPDRRFGTDIEEGFITSNGDFIDSEEAAKLWHGRETE